MSSSNHSADKSVGAIAADDDAGGGEQAHQPALAAPQGHGQPTAASGLSKEQRERIQRNRMKALERLRASRAKEATASAAAVPSAARAPPGRASAKLVAPGTVATPESEGPLFDESFECGECGHSPCDRGMYTTFGVQVCKLCRSSNDDYRLMSLTNAKKEFLVPASTLADMSFLSKENPRKGSRHPMKLYLRGQVRRASLKRWGGPAALEAERRRRASAKFKTPAARQRSAKRKRVLATTLGIDAGHGAEEVATGAGAGAGRSTSLSRRRTSMHSADHSVHRHSYSEDSHVYIPTSGLWQKTCSGCGLIVEFEKV